MTAQLDASTPTGDRLQFGRHAHWIGGAEAAPDQGEYLVIRSPLDRRPIAEIAAGSPADAERAIESAAVARKSWATKGLAERSAVLRRTGDLVRERIDEFVEIEHHEAGKLRRQAQGEMKSTWDYLDFYASVIRGMHGETIDHGEGNHAYTRHEPFGVVTIITPWNAALNQGVRGIAPALAAGNVVIVKPSEFTSLSTLLFARLATEAGLPDGVLNVVTGEGPVVGPPLVTDSRVRRVSFTGSVATGQVIGRAAADRIIPVALELGGKSPLIVFADADLDGAARAAAATVLVNSGQVCSATTRLIVERSVQDTLLELTADLLRHMEPGVHFGTIITEPQFEKVLGFFDSAAEEGARAVIGGHAYTEGSAADGYYIAPTIYADATPDMRIAREEIFGPVLTALPFDTTEEAIAIANDSEYGLGGAVWAGDAARGIAVAERLETGQVSVNGGALYNEMPFGGYKMSGIGREKGAQAIYEYSQVKTVSVGLRLDR
jgi:acyl-CoA reductase-like NAD-dependent aldehyde dehydrogenase